MDAARRDLSEQNARHIASDSAYKRKIADLDGALADALRRKNRERVARDNEVKKKVTMELQRAIEKSLKSFLDCCDATFKDSGVQFDTEASSEEGEVTVTPPIVPENVPVITTSTDVCDGPLPSQGTVVEESPQKTAAAASDSSSSSSSSSDGE